MPAFTVSTLVSTPFSLGAGDWLTVSRFGAIHATNNAGGAVGGVGTHAIQIDGSVANLSSTAGTSGIHLTSGADVVVIGAAGIVQGWSTGLLISAGGNTISCAGTVRALDGSSGTGVDVNGANNTITVEATGTVWGAESGISVGSNTTFKNFGTVIASRLNGVEFNGDGNSIMNAGKVDAVNYGMIVGFLGPVGSNSIVNTGLIRSGNDGILAGGGDNALFNSGRIESLFFNGYTSLGATAVINNGLIFAYGGIGLALADDVDTVVNNGFIQGRTFAAVLGEGNDLFDGRLGVQVGIVDAGPGNDTIYGGAQSDMLVGAADSDTLYGMGGIDALAGGDGVDILYGGEGADNLQGEAGTDLIYGGAGGDVIRGGIGGDLIVFNAGDNGDLIQNFNEGGARDGFDLRGYFNTTGFTGTDPRAAGIMQVLQNGADTDVYLHGAFAFRIQGVVAAAIDDSYFLFQ